MTLRATVYAVVLSLLVSTTGCKFGHPYPDSPYTPKLVNGSKPKNHHPPEQLTIHGVYGVEKLAKVSDILYRGEQPRRKGFQRLQRMGIKTVVNTRNFHSDRWNMHGTGLRYYAIPYPAWRTTDEDVVAFIKIMENTENHPVFVHCRIGVDRSGLMVAIYRVIFEGWSREDAIEEMKYYGYNAWLGNMLEYLEKVDFEKIKKMAETAEEPKLYIMD